MRPDCFKSEIQKRIEAGESLVALDQVPALKALSNSTRANMVHDGRLPAVRNGRRFLTLVSLVNEVLAGLIVEPGKTKPAKSSAGKGPIPGSGLAKLKAMGYREPVKK